MRILNIVETAYRATLEEQDDTAVWISFMLIKNGANIDLLLRGNAVNYAVKGQDASMLQMGGKPLTHPPDLGRDLDLVHQQGARVLVVQDDLEHRGIEADELIDCVTPVAEADLGRLMGEYQALWAW